MIKKLVLKVLPVYLTLLVCTGISVQAQDKIKVTGTVRDQQSQPVAAVTVKVSGSPETVLTDESGRYSIDVSATGSIEFNHISFLPQTIAVEGKSVIDVQLLQKENAMDEVVVVGYGTVKKSDVTGSVISLKADDL